ncbi:hypothetical protein QTP88_004975 [Uroleucon formosanum]
MCECDLYVDGTGKPKQPSPTAFGFSRHNDNNCFSRQRGSVPRSSGPSRPSPVRCHRRLQQSVPPPPPPPTPQPPSLPLKQCAPTRDRRSVKIFSYVRQSPR